jgi:putative ABC transport system permease protein
MALTTCITKPIIMFKNYFKIALRNLWKHRGFSAINIIGLSVGLAACIIIFLFVAYEKSFDNFHHKNIYRLDEVQHWEGMLSAQKVALSMFPMGPTLKAEFPEIQKYTRVNWHNNEELTYGEKRVDFPQICYVDSTFLQLFDFKLLEGDRATALQNPHSVVLTASGVRKLFGDTDPMGKTVTHYGEDTASFTVTGVLQDIPANSQLQFDGLYSFNTIYKPDWMNGWGGNWLDTYLELAPHTDPGTLEKKFPAYLKKYLARNDGWKGYTLFLQSLGDVHAGSSDIGLDYLNYQKFDKTYTNIFLAIALVVLLIACVNFMNLSTARSAERAREVGIRKAVGAYRVQLGMQFIGESVLLSLIALLVAIGLVELFLPYVNSLSQRDLRLFAHPTFLLWVLGGSLLVGILSGLYPAAYLSSFRPVIVLKGAIQTGRNKGNLRNILVVSQFASAIFLIIATLFAGRQLNYMRDLDPGFNREQIVTIPLNGLNSRHYNDFKEDLLQSSLFSGVTAAQDQLGSHLDQSGVEFKGDGPLRELATTRLIVDPDYLNLYQIPLVAGNNFSKDKASLGREYIINQALAKELLKDNPKAPLSSLLGRHFGFDSLGYIKGIARDFNFNSLHYKIETLFLFAPKDGGFGTVSVRINGAKTAEAIAYIESTWKKLFPDSPFEYQFLDDHFANLYLADTQVSKIVGILAVLAILISCLGLFGLSSYAAEKRTKEVGIRKVLGASVNHIVTLLSGDFLRLVLVANLIAWPLAWYTTHRWLEGFAYRIALSWWVFGLAGLLSVCIAIFTISYMAVKAAIANPIKSLRTE